MAPSDDRKDLTALARSIDALFAGQRRDETTEDQEESAVPSRLPASSPTDAPPAEEVFPTGEAPAAAAVATEDAPPTESAHPAEEVSPTEAAPPTEGAPPTGEVSPAEESPAAEDAVATRSPAEDVVWEAVPSQEGPGLQPKPDVDAFREAIGTFIASDRLARDGQGRGIREMAAALREAGSLDALADAVERLASTEADSADEACLAMARALVSPAVASRLAARLGAEHDELRRAELIVVCRRIGHDMALAVADALSDTTDRYARRAFMEAMVAMGPAGMDVVEQMMEDPRWFVVRNAVAVLGGVSGDRAVELVTTGLAHPDARVRREALLALAHVGGEDAGLLVYGMIQDTDPDVRLAAAMAAGELKVERALKPLLGLLESESADHVVVGVLHALGRLGDPGAVGSIEKRAVGSFFSRPSTDVRIAAYRALHNIGTPHAKQLLDGARDDKNPEVRTAVRQLLASR